MTRTTQRQLLSKLEAYFRSHGDEWNFIMEAMDDLEGYLDDNRRYDMGDIEDLFLGAREALQKIHGDFNITHKYFYFDGYGHLHSTNVLDYSVFLNMDDTLEDVVDCWGRLKLYPEDIGREAFDIFEKLATEDIEEDENEETEETKKIEF